MIEGRLVLGLVPARGGSKAVPRKNVRPLAGKPLIQWTAEAALASRYIDRCVLSTDDDEIAAVGAAAGLDVPFRRPGSLGADDATARDVVLHALDGLREPYDLVVYLQPTSPLRTTDDIDGCIERRSASGADYCVSVHRAPVRPDLMYYLGESDRLEPVPGTFAADRRQEARPGYVLNGAVYVADVAAFRRDGTFLTERTVAFVMPAERGLDLDDRADFDLAEAALRRRTLTEA